ncbi:hypothetical protein Pse7367_2081 [Thalassoporum mexicanum PCC 7367]|uniref:DUF5908 family protein n=1 Tax=Thalassoporum mexicanum TaxID=3457544 RepID=UPI00029F9B1B|nr:DUF5908 family protein [Pseudanabaena sp. PCC 7367]AFY70349.1 hypothetical protein Pse7367_2081 [Pseudanabaena sp. PCC 7367]
MPLEIRELVIRTTVASDRNQAPGNSIVTNDNLSEADQAAIVTACVDQVLYILQSRSER